MFAVFLTYYRCHLICVFSQELLARNIPYYEIKGDAPVINAIYQGKLPSEPDLSKPKNSELWSICNKCWAALPQARPSTVQLVEELDVLLEIQYELRVDLVHTLRHEE